MGVSPTQRSLAHLRDLGYELVQVVEKWVPQARKRIDLYGIIDICAIHPDIPGVLGVQSTSATNFSHRIRKSQESTALPLWIANGNRFEVHGWGKYRQHGTKRKAWQVKVANDADIRLYGRGDPGDSGEAATSDHSEAVRSDHERKDQG